MACRRLPEGALRNAVGISPAPICYPDMRSLALACLFIGGCAAAESDCRTGDWYALGERDPRRAMPALRGAGRRVRLPRGLGDRQLEDQLPPAELTGSSFPRAGATQITCPDQDPVASCPGSAE